MPTYYEGEAIAAIENYVSEDDFVSAYVNAQARRGKLQFAKIKAALFGILGVWFLLMIPAYQSSYQNWRLPVCCALVCLFMAAYFLFLLPAETRGTARAVYQSNQLIRMDHTVTLYRDSYQIKNKYETLRGHWTDIRECVETEAYFLLIGGWDRDLLILIKRPLEEEEITKLRSHFEAEFAKRYRRMK